MTDILLIAFLLMFKLGGVCFTLAMPFVLASLIRDCFQGKR